MRLWVNRPSASAGRDLVPLLTSHRSFHACVALGLLMLAVIDPSAQATPSDPVGPGAGMNAATLNSNTARSCGEMHAEGYNGPYAMRLQAREASGAGAPVVSHAHTRGRLILDAAVCPTRATPVRYGSDGSDA